MKVFLYQSFLVLILQLQFYRVGNIFLQPVVLAPELFSQFAYSNYPSHPKVHRRRAQSERRGAQYHSRQGKLLDNGSIPRDAL